MAGSAILPVTVVRDGERDGITNAIVAEDSRVRIIK